MNILDCTLRDGGYYNNWDFDEDLVNEYLETMDSIQIDFLEIGFRTLKKDNFKGAFAYSTDDYLNTLNIPKGLINKIGVMINASEISNSKTQTLFLEKLFKPKSKSPVSLVRIACHLHELNNCLPAVEWLKKRGYLVGLNLMQISNCSYKEITKHAKKASKYPIDVLYFADSLGSLDSQKIDNIIKAFKAGWQGELGIHTHDNMGQALANVNKSIDAGVTWVDGTINGMGRGPGNAQTEYLILALKKNYKNNRSLIQLLKLIKKYFKPLQIKYKWGINPFYFLAGKNSIHPTYIQEMMQDDRYKEEDIISAIEYLKNKGGKNFSYSNLNLARQFYSEKPKGSWLPEKLIKNKSVLILGSGPGVKRYKNAIENYIKKNSPYVIALNTQSNVKKELIDSRAVCHPMRLLVDFKEFIKLPQPIITPFSMLPQNLKEGLKNKKIFNFGIKINNKTFVFKKNYCEIPVLLVLAYSIAIANSGKAKEIFLAGFDGYQYEDPRRKEIDQLLNNYNQTKNSVLIKSITPTNYGIPIISIYSQ